MRENKLGLRGVKDYLTMTGGHYEPAAVIFDLLFPEGIYESVHGPARHCLVRAMQHISGDVGNTFPSTKNGELLPFDTSVSC